MDLSDETWTKVREILGKFYHEVDMATARLSAVHADRLQCRRGCSGCCTDGLTVFEVEAHNIQHHHADMLAQQQPAAPEGCAFLDDEGGCRIYEHRPYVCRTQGLPLRWLDEHDDGRVVEMRDICPLNDMGQPIEELKESDCWAIGPFEELLANLQTSIDGGELKRVSLRELWDAPSIQDSGISRQEKKTE